VALACRLMAKQTQVRVTDDIDGSDADEEVLFAFRGAQYEIDLSARNVEALEKALARYVKAGREVRPARGTTRRSATTRSAKAAKEDVATMREWAKANGYRVADRGRVSTEIREAFQAAGG
jgi:hypothetical protein